MLIPAFQHLDPLSGTVKKHVFWGLMKVFRKEYITLAFLMTFRVSLLMHVRTSSLQPRHTDARWIHESSCRQPPSHVGNGITRAKIINNTA